MSRRWEQLQPPCECWTTFLDMRVDCTDAAEFVGRAICPNCGTKVCDLFCPRHKRMFATETTVCTPCQTPITIVWERLR